MNTNLGGFATLTALAVMMLLVAYLAIGSTASAQIELKMTKETLQDQSLAWKTLDDALEVLDVEWHPDQQAFSAWTALHPIPGLSWESLSGRMNLNTVSPFVMGLTDFASTLRGVSVSEFVEKRSLAGPSADGELYKELITPAAMASWYTTHSLWNLNTADEGMLEAMANQRSGGAGVGSALRTTVRAFRENRKRITEDEWQKVAGGAEVLAPLVTLEPEIDVNEASESLLLALLSNPAWNVADPTGKTRALVDSRRNRPWNQDRLKAVLQVSDDNLLLSYLGVRTRFLAGDIETPKGTLHFIVFLEQKGGDYSSRITQTVWNPR